MHPRGAINAQAFVIRIAEANKEKLLKPVPILIEYGYKKYLTILPLVTIWKYWGSVLDLPDLVKIVPNVIVSSSPEQLSNVLEVLESRRRLRYFNLHAQV